MKNLSKTLAVLMMVGGGGPAFGVTACANGSGYVADCIRASSAYRNQVTATCNATQSNGPCIMSTSGVTDRVCITNSHDACSVCFGVIPAGKGCENSWATSDTLRQVCNKAYKVYLASSGETCTQTAISGYLYRCVANYYGGSTNASDYGTAENSSMTCTQCPQYRVKSAPTNSQGTSAVGSAQVSDCKMGSPITCSDTAGTYTATGGKGSSTAACCVAQ